MGSDSGNGRKKLWYGIKNWFNFFFNLQVLSLVYGHHTTNWQLAYVRFVIFLSGFDNDFETLTLPFLIMQWLESHIVKTFDSF